jgi:putative transposase
VPDTYSQIYIQIVFAVKGRQHFITEMIREDLQRFITGIVQQKKQKLLALYCMPDHVHVFVSIQPSIAISDLVRDIKANSTLWIKSNFKQMQGFSWQEGFGAFSYAKSQVQQVVDYILKQPEHHRKTTFRQEYTAFLKAFEVEYKDEYLFEFYL